MEYVCIEGDRLDLICFKVYGHHNNGIIKKVQLLNADILTGLYLKHIENNAGFYDASLPEGIALRLPELKEVRPKKPVRRLF